MTQELEHTLRDLRLAEQSILRESLEDKSIRLKELEAEVVYLRRLLNEITAVPRVAPAMALAGATVRRAGDAPRRWRV